MTPSREIITTVRLQAGEQFVLPPNGTLIAVSDTSSLSSTCDIPSTLEEYDCYTFIISVPGKEGNEAQFGETSRTKILGYEIDGNLYPVPTGAISPLEEGDGQFDLTYLKNQLSSIPYTGFIIISCVSGYAGSSRDYSNPTDRGALTFITFRTIPSIAKKLLLKLQINSPLDSDTGEAFAFNYVKPYLRTDVENIYTGICECSSTQVITPIVETPPTVQT